MTGRFWLLAAIARCPVSVLAQMVRDDHMDGYGHMMNSWGGAIVMWLLPLIVIGILVYFLIRSSGAGGFGSGPRETPLDILKKRYARGEITKEQFDEMKKDL